MAILVAMTPAALAELDSETLALAQGGDAGARQALVERYQRPIFALLSRMLRSDPSALDDLAQETFLRCFRALPDFDRGGPARLSTWLLTIAARLAIDHLRRKPLPSRVERIEAHAHRLGAETAAAPLGLGEALRRAVEALPPVFRAAFLLREAHGLSYEEIALTLEVDLGTVRSRLSRARSALRVALEEHHG